MATELTDVLSENWDDWPPKTRVQFVDTNLTAGDVTSEIRSEADLSGDATHGFSKPELCKLLLVLRGERE